MPKQTSWTLTSKASPKDLDELLQQFQNFLVIDLTLARDTAERHAQRIKKFLRRIAKGPSKVSVEDVRSYLKPYREGNLRTYMGELRALKRFYRDFLNMPYLVDTFKFPTDNGDSRPTPSKEKIQQFYYALDDLAVQALYLLVVSSGLRRQEVLSLTWDRVDIQTRTIDARGLHETARTKRSWFTFYNEEAESKLLEYKTSRSDIDPRVLPPSESRIKRCFNRAEKKVAFRISLTDLRNYFSNVLGDAEIPDRYVDAMLGHVPRRVLARHYSDLQPERLRKHYLRANLKILS